MRIRPKYNYYLVHMTGDRGGLSRLYRDSNNEIVVHTPINNRNLSIRGKGILSIYKHANGYATIIINTELVATAMLIDRDGKGYHSCFTVRDFIVTKCCVHADNNATPMDMYDGITKEMIYTIMKEYELMADKAHVKCSSKDKNESIKEIRDYLSLLNIKR
ncbi:MAG: hypothetical protein DRG30_05100 [Epsilonproteobacteria bacterium]|nr:MAG: hypothetical protein DRG30_05100 [Campylobacterota bacterium]